MHSLACTGTSSSRYDLIANIVHDGKAGQGTYRAHIQRKVEEIW
jgi:U4/U6.U5 tri-snRNP-associated protein 2